MHAGAGQLRSLSAIPTAGKITTIGLESLRLARSVLQEEASALMRLADQLDGAFSEMVDAIHDCRGSVIVMGVGKAGLVGQKLSATFASTGSPSHFLHPSEAMHGDLGRLRGEDAILVLSFSGETEEITRVLPSLQSSGCLRMAITRDRHSTLGQHVDHVLELGPLSEADPLGLAPSTSTTAMLGLGDALALAVARQRRFQPHDFARLHPGGSLGRQLMTVEQAMRPLSSCRMASEQTTVRDVLLTGGHAGRRTGAIMLINNQGKLSGIFTDSDLARLFEQRRESTLDGPIADVMCDSPTVVVVGTRLPEAIDILAKRKISELPVVDTQRCPLGIIDITDLVLSDAAATDAAAASDAAPQTLARDAHLTRCVTTRQA